MVDAVEKLLFGLESVATDCIRKAVLVNSRWVDGSVPLARLIVHLYG
jgi:hypothetical protein